MLRTVRDQVAESRSLQEGSRVRDDAGGGGAVAGSGPRRKNARLSRGSEPAILGQIAHKRRYVKYGRSG